MKRIFTSTAMMLLAMLTLCSQAVAQRTQPDELCQLLFDTYIKGPAKIDSTTMNSAIHLIANRGRNNGFWEAILTELQEGQEASETGCVQILGKMLETDAMARQIIERQNRTGEISQWVANVALPAQVVEVLMERGEKADRFRAEHYVIALSRANVPTTREFFRMILRDGSRDGLPGTQFHAAVGLAQLGDVEGYEWLIANCDDPTPTVGNAWPQNAKNNNLNECCNAALQRLSGNYEVSGRQQWEAWLASADKSNLPRTAVRYQEP